MKQQELQILQFLQAFDTDKVWEAFELYKNSLDSNNEVIEKSLIEKGYIKLETKPTDNTPYHVFNNFYWVLSQQSKDVKVKELKEKTNKNVNERKEKTKKTNISLSKTIFKCPKCDNILYKQRLCPACKEGRKGYIFRFICEQNPDHEFLV